MDKAFFIIILYCFLSPVKEGILENIISALSEWYGLSLTTSLKGGISITCDIPEQEAVLKIAIGV